MVNPSAFARISASTDRADANFSARVDVTAPRPS
jgi:hypothetical protein